MMFSPFSRRHGVHRVVVAVVYEPERRKFLVVFNPRWGGYTFPMCRKRPRSAPDTVREREHVLEEAQQALRKDLGSTLGEAREAHWMDRIGVLEVSGRTGQRTHYIYDIVTVIPAQPLPDGAFAGRFGLLSAEDIRDSDPAEPGSNGLVVTWTTWQVLTKLLDNQQAAVAVVSRVVNGQHEYLMTRNREGKWFFPAVRMGDPVPPDRLIVHEFKSKANYLGKVVPAREPKLVELEQATQHLGPRRYTFHLYRTDFPQEDLLLSGNRLEAALDQAGVEFRWLGKGGPDLSDTAMKLWPYLP